MNALRPLLLLPFLCAAAAGGAPDADRPPELRITVVGDWGEAPRENVEKLLRSAAGELARQVPDRTLPAIIVSPGEGSPITLFDKAPGGETQVRLTARGLFWSQYVYQFSHELGHVLCNYEKRSAGGNAWFEEAVCETSSLFVLRRLAVTWQKDPPYENWRGFAPRMDDYANAILARRDRRLAPDTTMPQWYRARQQELRKQEHPTADSMLVAAYLLPLFEDEPNGWQALAWLNQDKSDGQKDFEGYLRAWHGRTPEQHKAFIVKIMRLFGFEP